MIICWYLCFQYWCYFLQYLSFWCCLIEEVRIKVARYFCSQSKILIQKWEIELRALKKFQCLFSWTRQNDCNLSVLCLNGFVVSQKNRHIGSYFAIYALWDCSVYLKKKICVPHLATYIFLSFQLLNEPGLGEGIDPGMALTPFPSSIVLDKIQTHDLPIVSRVC